jgi:hypothetical protein
MSWAWWYIAVIPAVRMLRQEKHKFKASLGYIASSRTAWMHNENLSQETKIIIIIISNNNNDKNMLVERNYISVIVLVAIAESAL